VFARPKALQLQALDLKALVADAVMMLGRDPLGAALDIEVTGDPVQVLADGELVRATLLNLLLNAAQAMAGQGRIRVDLASGHDTVTIEIRDSGPGIAPEARGRIFEPFFTTKSRGGGLGLAIAKRTAERHGGSLHLTCPPEGGTIANLVLPTRPGSGDGRRG
jgi:two-component system sensor histidine kinase HydH